MFKPHKHQLEAVAKLEAFAGRALLAGEPGVGKTAEALLWLHNHPEIKRVVVLCPASLKYHWQTEAKRFFGIRGVILETRKAKATWRTPPRLLIINYDILQWWVPVLKQYAPELMIVDECHFLGSPKAKWTRAAKLLSKDIPHLIGLSGTPLLNRPVELFPFLNMLRPDLYPSFFPYGMRYCGARRNPWGWQFNGAAHLKELHRKLTADLMVRQRKIDVIDNLPSKSRHVLALPLSNFKEYQAAEKDFINWLRKTDPVKVTGAQRAEGVVQINHLRQLTGKLKLPAVLQWMDGFLKESEDKLILYAVHKKVVAALMDHFGRKAVKVDGSVTGKHRQKAFDQFNGDKRTRVFVGNIRAAGLGWSARHCSTVAFAELAWTPGAHVQAEDRIHGLERGLAGVSASIYYLIGKGSIEEKHCQLIQKKQKTLDTVLDNGKVATTLDIFDELCRELRRTLL